MCKAKFGFLGVVLTSLIATSAWASDVQGRVVCTGTQNGVANVKVTLSTTDETGTSTYSALTGSDGVFNVHVYPIWVNYGVVLDLSAVGGGSVDEGSYYIAYGVNPTPIVLPDFQVNVPGCTVSTCKATAGLADGYLCAERPLGNPKAECGSFGLVALDKNDNVSGSSTPAEYDAALAIVKAGSCITSSGGTGSAYNYYVDVTKGEALSSPTSGGISHVTYCACQ